jgi:hypothetical protein
VYGTALRIGQFAAASPVAARLQQAARMRILRRFVRVAAICLPLVAGCGGTEPPLPSNTVDMAGAAGNSGSDAGSGTLALFAACTSNDQCQSGLCTQTSYDRSPTPICTYMCDASNTNPKCPSGCNPKGYCKMGTGNGAGGM